MVEAGPHASPSNPFGPWSSTKKPKQKTAKDMGSESTGKRPLRLQEHLEEASRKGPTGPRPNSDQQILLPLLTWLHLNPHADRVWRHSSSLSSTFQPYYSSGKLFSPTLSLKVLLQMATKVTFYNCKSHTVLGWLILAPGNWLVSFQKCYDSAVKHSNYEILNYISLQ